MRPLLERLAKVVGLLMLLTFAGTVGYRVVVGDHGRYGRAVVEELLGAGRAVVVMDENPELVPVLEARGLAYVIASASPDAGLLEAGVQ